LTGDIQFPLIVFLLWRKANPT